jgi:hypothetical protein
MISNQNRRGGDFWTAANSLLVKIQKSPDKEDFGRKGLFGVGSIIVHSQSPDHRHRPLVALGPNLNHIKIHPCRKVPRRPALVRVVSLEYPAAPSG